MTFDATQNVTLNTAAKDKLHLVHLEHQQVLNFAPQTHAYVKCLNFRVKNQSLLGTSETERKLKVLTF